ncbi:MAG: hypothetical protein H6741_05110 [Alphaproteobacteria bacterium]|nr:hypothetical protein [Alphaproteobacteria bacterium]MCB9792085.1 hypothetical protein [Alphaproteobacteria bacterium]
MRLPHALAGLSLLLSAVALATPPAAEIQAGLDSDAGWTQVTVSQGVTVYKKDLPGVEVPALKGVKEVDVNSDTLFDVIADINGQPKVNDMLRESAIIKEEGPTIWFYQVLDSPFPASDRYWVLKGQNLRDIGGVDGHHKQTWELLPETSFAKVHTAVKDKYDAVLTPLNYGSWEVEPLGPNKSRLTYRVVSNPGGNIPDGAFAWGSEKSLPNNLLVFENAAKK